MSPRNVTSRFRLLCGVLAAVVLVPLSMGQTVDNKPEVKQEVLDKVTFRITQQAFVPGIDFSKWPQFLESEKPKIQAANNDDDFERAVNEALFRFGASHVALTTPRMNDMRRTGSTVGIGVSSQIVQKGLLIVRVVSGAPADKAGLKPGDVIVAVDGQKADGTKGIPGKEGTKVKLTVLHPDTKQEEYTLVRKPFSTVRPEQLDWINPDTAKLTIYTFDFTYNAANVEKLMAEVEKKKAKNLILDLRNNGGGAVIYLQHLLGLLVPANDPVGTFVSKNSVDKFALETGGSRTDLAAIAKWSPNKLRPSSAHNLPVYDGHVAVLVNGFSGSASEICAAGLRDTIGATIVGTKSAGAVLVSVITDATNGFMLQYPLQDYVTIRGVRLEGTGVSPDVEVKDPFPPLPSATDEVVGKAAALLAKEETAIRA